MTARAPRTISIPGVAGALSERYERVRALVLEARRVQRGEGGLSVLLRQGMIPWMQLAAERCVGPSRRARAAPIPAPVRAPVRSELLVMLTELVFGASCGRS